MRTIIISDLHLGSKVSKTVAILLFLEQLQCDLLIVAGDLFDSWSLGNLDEACCRIIDNLRNRKAVILRGNHGGGIVADLLGNDVDCEFTSANKTIYVTHGNQWDDTLDKWYCPIASAVYWLAQEIDNLLHTRIATMLKNWSKRMTNTYAKVEAGAKLAARLHDADYVVCGHTHMATMDGPYLNCGSWTEECAYVCVEDGEIRLDRYQESST
jgi:UDP-2,3-diacylglucosamine pyrophosphatase LpxH